MENYISHHSSAFVTSSSSLSSSSVPSSRIRPSSHFHQPQPFNIISNTSHPEGASSSILGKRKIVSSEGENRYGSVIEPGFSRDDTFHAGSSSRFISSRYALESDIQWKKKRKMETSIASTTRSFVCEETGCNQAFSTAREWKTHIAQHNWGPHAIEKDPKTGKTSFRCLRPGCNKIVFDRKLLRKHLITHKAKQFKCHYEGCGKQFYERAKLKRHFLVHTGEKAFECTYPNCSKRFGYKANLKTHLRTHTGLRPYECTVPGCLRRFAQASNRNSHVLTHRKEKPNINRNPISTCGADSGSEHDISSDASSSFEASSSFQLSHRSRKGNNLSISVEHSTPRSPGGRYEQSQQQVLRSPSQMQHLLPPAQLLRSFALSPSTQTSFNSSQFGDKKALYSLSNGHGSSYCDNTLDVHSLSQMNHMDDKSPFLSLSDDAFSILSTPTADVKAYGTVNTSLSSSTISHSLHHQKYENSHLSEVSRFFPADLEDSESQIESSSTTGVPMESPPSSPALPILGTINFSSSSSQSGGSDYPNSYFMF